MPASVIFIKRPVLFFGILINIRERSVDPEENNYQFAPHSPHKVSKNND
jgi:hypothetical protein